MGRTTLGLEDLDDNIWEVNQIKQKRRYKRKDDIEGKIEINGYYVVTFNITPRHDLYKQHDKRNRIMAEIQRRATEAILDAIEEVMLEEGYPKR